MGASSMAGFLFATAASFAAMSSGWAAANLRFGALALVLAAFTALFGLSARRGRAYWISFFIALATLIALFGVEHAQPVANERGASYAARLLTVSALLVIPNSIAMLAAHRRHPGIYLLLVAAIGAINYVVQESIAWGLATATLTAMVLTTTGYVVQFFHDHSWELEQWSSHGSRLKAARLLGRTAIPWLLAAGLAAVGTLLYQCLQDATEFQLYASGIVVQDPNASELDLQHDLKYTLSNREEVDESLVHAEIERGSRDADTIYQDAPAIVDRAAQGFRPPPIRDSPCGGIHWSVSWFAAPLCRALFQSINDLIAKTFNGIHLQTVSFVQQKTEKLKAENMATTQELQRTLGDAVRWEYAGYKSAVDYMFAYLRIANWISIVYLLGSLIAVFQWFACRIAFDAAGPTFRLSAKEGQAESVDFVARTSLFLDEYPYKVWYVSRSGVNAKGDGLSDSAIPPQPLNCAVGRIRKRRYFLSKAKISSTSAMVKDRPQIQVHTPDHLVAVAVCPGQRLVFRMEDLCAFSEGVSLNSTYTAHSATNFLRLPRFYASAEGEGHIVLRGEGKIDSEKDGAKLEPADLLVWDVRAEMSLDQASTGIGMWINEPRIHVRSAAESIVSQSVENDYIGPLKKSWRLLRFVAISW